MNIKQPYQEVSLWLSVVDAPTTEINTMQATIDETETKSKAQLKSVMDAYDKLKE